MELSQRTLNRTTLDRQLLLGRVAISPLELMRRLVAVQAQEANAPYIGLWNRVADFTLDDLTGLLYDRSVVRGSLLRGTQHLAAADDYLWLRPLMQLPMTRARQAAFGRTTRDVDLDELVALAREHLAGAGLTRPELARLLSDRWPDAQRLALGWSAQALLPIVHPPPNGTWNTGGATPFALAEEWIGRPLETAPPVERLITRYLASFGPATVKDVQVWSGLTRLREVMEAMPLCRYGALYDLPDASLADEETPAPVRFLPWYDNVLLAYADRTRIMTDELRKKICVGAITYPTFLIDGVARGIWDLKDATLVILPFERIPDDEAADLEKEGRRLLAFAGLDENNINWLPEANDSPTWPPPAWPSWR